MINPVLRVICQFYAKNLGWNILSSFDPNIFYCTHKDLMIIKIYYQKKVICILLDDFFVFKMS